MTGHIYGDVILEQHVRLFRDAMSAEFLFMDDNARPHRANIVDECLQSEDITPRQPSPTCLPELRRALRDEWCNIPQDQIDNLILSLPRRCSRRLIVCVLQPIFPIKLLTAKIFKSSAQNVFVVHRSIAINVIPTPALQVPELKLMSQQIRGLLRRS
ncbi:transposable element Tcb2 transposase [Trichonephila clavipes]|nr:transposable element Tcb2 transposase [Trichonephila clavipes]